LFYFQTIKQKPTALKIFTRFSCFLLLMFHYAAHSQDIHFSMFYASPLNLNPALTGVTDGSYRVSGIYRNQWRSITTPFVTYSASYDMKLLQTKLPNDIFGVGGTFVGDRSGNGKLTMNSGMVSASYHKGLDKNHRHFLGLGIQMGYTNKSLQWQQLAFPTQFNGSDFDLSQSNGEQNIPNNFGYFDMQAGFLHQSTFNDVISMMTGLSVYHLVPPKQSFLGDKTVKLPMRYTAHMGFRIRPMKNFYITPNFIFQHQAKAMEINFGTAFEYHLPAGKSTAIVSLGGWYRLKDAAIVTAAVEYYRVRAMFAYDVNTSTLNSSTRGRGGFEVAVIYTGFIKPKGVSYPVLVPCPMM
jgi:type IX secretion system PorP/SprF family membrane protein